MPIFSIKPLAFEAKRTLEEQMRLDKNTMSSDSKQLKNHQRRQKEKLIDNRHKSNGIWKESESKAKNEESAKKAVSNEKENIFTLVWASWLMLCVMCHVSRH